MFQLAKAEFENLKSQIAISSWGGVRRVAPDAFTGQGVAMRSSVLRSRCVIQPNITIMWVFVKLRAMVSANKELADKLVELERRVASHDEHIQSLSSKPFGTSWRWKSRHSGESDFFTEAPGIKRACEIVNAAVASRDCFCAQNALAQHYA